MRNSSKTKLNLTPDKRVWVALGWKFIRWPLVLITRPANMQRHSITQTLLTACSVLSLTSLPTVTDWISFVYGAACHGVTTTCDRGITRITRICHGCLVWQGTLHSCSTQCIWLVTLPGATEDTFSNCCIVYHSLRCNVCVNTKRKPVAIVSIIPPTTTISCHHLFLSCHPKNRPPKIEPTTSVGPHPGS